MSRIWIGSIHGVIDMLTSIGADFEGETFRVEGPHIDSMLKSNDPSDVEYPYVQIVSGTTVFVGGEPQDLLTLIEEHNVDSQVQLLQ